MVVKCMMSHRRMWMSALRVHCGVQSALPCWLGGAPRPNPDLARALAAAPALVGAVAALAAPLDVAAEAAALMWGADPDADAENLPEHRPYLHCEGSLTMPPCSEGVDWLVLDCHGAVAGLQARGLAVRQHGFNRPKASFHV